MKLVTMEFVVEGSFAKEQSCVGIVTVVETTPVAMEIDGEEKLYEKKSSGKAILEKMNSDELVTDLTIAKGNRTELNSVEVHARNSGAETISNVESAPELIRIQDCSGSKIPTVDDPESI
ncbi:hypothetical protein TanjilG_20933 [Lupinus angustifolius]|uniref:Uncharacterized protein n=1 Tax=Lupinus angustifolius TaxID=3871 RepID=A0A1J7FNI5_LUPAN|nr:hypothetical protein TanjilG_20933 [Lupinus angustifolius]